jgi:hypothetical protein
MVQMRKSADGVLLRALALVYPILVAHACSFHCIGSLCGGVIGQVNQTVFVGAGLGVLARDGHFVGAGGTFSRVTLLDLRHRGITAISPGGFDCYATPGNRFDGVTLDHNPLGQAVPGGGLPAGGVFHLFETVSMRNCSIRQITEGQMASYLDYRNGNFSEL